MPRLGIELLVLVSSYLKRLIMHDASSSEMVCVSIPSNKTSGHAENLVKRRGLNLTWSDIHYEVSLNKKKKGSSTTKVILSGMNGLAKAGQMVAIMGPTGSGKVSSCTPPMDMFINPTVSI